MNLEILGDGKRKRRIKDLCEVDYSKKGSEKPEAERKPNPSDKDSELESELPDAYERVLYDCIRGDQSLFASTDEVKASWSFITPIVEAWKNTKSKVYDVGSDILRLYE